MHKLLVFFACDSFTVRGLWEKWDDSGTTVSTNDSNRGISWVGIDDTSQEAGRTDNVECGDTE